MKNIVIIAIAAIVFIFATATYTVDQRETAIKFRFKEIVEADIKPGLSGVQNSGLSFESI